MIESIITMTGIIIIIFLNSINEVVIASSELRLGAVFDISNIDGTINAHAATDITAHLIAVSDANLRHKNFSITIKTAIKNSKMRFSDCSVAGNNYFFSRQAFLLLLFECYRLI